MPVLGRQFYFPFSHCTRVDAMFTHLGAELTDVEVDVYDRQGALVLSRRFLDVEERGSVSTRHDPKADNLMRHVGANLAGLVSVHGTRNALLTASALIIGKGMTSCALLRPVAYAVGTRIHVTAAIGEQFHLLLANPYVAEAEVHVEVAASGGEYRALQAPILLGPKQTVVTEDAFNLGKPVVVRATGTRDTPFLAWGLGIDDNRTELYPLYG